MLPNKPRVRYLAGVLLPLLLALAACDTGGKAARVIGDSTGIDPDDALGQLPADQDGSDTPTVDLPPPNPGGDYLLGIGTRLLVDPYVRDAPLREAMVHCTVTLREGEECNLRQLPFLGMEHSDPVIDDVMERVLVSHEWMGLRFRELLEVMPADILRLARPLTTIVISFDIRPSFYTTWTGAIYLDPEDLWLTQEERANIDTTPDYRSGYGDELAFATLWRYVKDNEYATRPPTEGTRTIAEIRYAMAALLYHELAHANDYFYPGKDLSGVMDVPLYRAARGSIPSGELANQYPLRSNILVGLGMVRYYGVDPTAKQRSYTPDDVAAEFQNDYANAFYSYASEREDLAMLFEELMMLYNFDVDRDVGVTNRPGSNRCEEYLVAWGERNRVLDSAVGNRALFIAERVLPEWYEQLAEYLAQGIATSRAMTPGVDWCANRFLDATVEPRALATVPQRGREQERADTLVPYL